MSARDLRRSERPMNSTDDDRHDEYDGHISCSIEYPNSWFLAVAQTRELLFKDWVILEIDPQPLWWGETLYCTVNAAKSGGKYVAAGEQAFANMFDVSPDGSQQSRGMLHLDPCPTDDQAEALVSSPIDVELIHGIITATSEQSLIERSRLDLLGYDTSRIEWKAAPDLFDPRKLAGSIRSGERPPETIITFD